MSAFFVTGSKILPSLIDIITPLINCDTIFLILFFFLIKATNCCGELLEQDPVCQDLHSLFKTSKNVVYCDIKSYDETKFIGRSGTVTRGFNFGNPLCLQDALSLRIVIRPRNAVDVAEVVKYIAKSNGTLELSIRSGGHSYTCNSVKPGSVHLDLRSLDEVEIVPNIIDAHPSEDEDELLQIGTGNRFQDIFTLVDKNKYSFVHGECFTVGVGGFFLHGGAHAGMLTSKYGLGNESIRALEMVTANGDILTFVEARTKKTSLATDSVNKTTSPIQYERHQVQVLRADGTRADDGYKDLWNAIRVAGSSFGVVTKLTVQLWKSPEPHVWFFFVLLNGSQLYQLMEDALLNGNVQINLYTNVRKGFVQISLRNGPTDPNENYRECKEWLNQWMIKHGVTSWKWRLFSYLLVKINPWFPLQDRFDYGQHYLRIGWTSSSYIVHWSQARQAMKFYSTAYKKYRKKAYCVLVYVPVPDNRLHMDNMCFGKDSEKHLQNLDNEFGKKFPFAIKYVNVPIRMESIEENNEKIRRYFQSLDYLRKLKTIYDPKNLFSPFQGILPSS